MVTIARPPAAPAGATLRMTSPADLPLLRRLRRAAGADGDLPEPVQPLLGAPTLGGVWLLEVHATPAGYLAVRWRARPPAPEGVAAAEELLVVPALRGRGLGAWALEVAGRACEGRGVRELWVKVEEVR